MKNIRKLLIANRGEIAVRIIRTARKMGVHTVAVYAAADADAIHHTTADEAFLLDGTELSETYLNATKIIEIALKAGCDAIHPGYGFLSENAAFAEEVESAGLVFVGPSAQAIHLMGNKIEARRKVKEIGVPLLDGVTGSAQELYEKSEHFDFPVLVKAAAGGGGKGMRIVRHRNDMAEALEATSREAKAYFGDEAVYFERFLENPRHIEVQILGDKHGNVVHLFERECSLQRRYQKIIEESPSITLDDAARKKMGDTAVAIAKSIGYYNAGTVEFLVDQQLNYYFLEMNTRIQVEHPVTEMVTGIDLVEQQLRVVSGYPLSFSQQQLVQKGHAIEARIYAEDPWKNFMPSPGKMTFYQEPSGDDIRVDSGVDQHTEIKPFYDPMISKLIVFGKDRQQATNKLLWALDRYSIHGISNNLMYLKALASSADFAANQISTKYCDEKSPEIMDNLQSEREKIPLWEPLAAYLLKELTDRSDENVWRQIGLWKQLLSIPVQYEEKVISVEVSQLSANKYLLTQEHNSVEVTLQSLSDNTIVYQVDGISCRADFSEAGLITTIVYQGYYFRFGRNDRLDENVAYRSDENMNTEGGDVIVSPMHGKLIKLYVGVGDAVGVGDTLAIVEAMKMENVIKSPAQATIKEIKSKEGEQVSSNQVLILLQE